MVIQYASAYITLTVESEVKTATIIPPVQVISCDADSENPQFEQLEFTVIAHIGDTRVMPYVTTDNNPQELINASGVMFRISEVIDEPGDQRVLLKIDSLPSDFSESNSYTCSLDVYFKASGNTFKKLGEVSLLLIKKANGEDLILAMLNNETMMIKCNSDGSPVQGEFGPDTINVAEAYMFFGDTLLQYTESPTPNDLEYTIRIDSSGCDAIVAKGRDTTIAKIYPTNLLEKAATIRVEFITNGSVDDPLNAINQYRTIKIHKSTEIGKPSKTRKAYREAPYPGVGPTPPTATTYTGELGGSWVEHRYMPTYEDNALWESEAVFSGETDEIIQPWSPPIPIVLPTPKSVAMSFYGVFNPEKEYYIRSDVRSVVYVLDVNKRKVYYYTKILNELDPSVRVYDPGSLTLKFELPATLSGNNSMKIPEDVVPFADTTYWKPFQAQYESVATGLLLAETAYIGNLSSAGIIIGSPLEPGEEETGWILDESQIKARSGSLALTTDGNIVAGAAGMLGNEDGRPEQKPEQTDEDYKDELWNWRTKALRFYAGADQVEYTEEGTPLPVEPSPFRVYDSGDIYTNNMQAEDISLTGVVTGPKFSIDNGNAIFESLEVKKLTIDGEDFGAYINKGTIGAWTVDKEGFTAGIGKKAIGIEMQLTNSLRPAILSGESLNPGGTLTNLTTIKSSKSITLPTDNPVYDITLPTFRFKGVNNMAKDGRRYSHLHFTLYISIDLNGTRKSFESPILVISGQDTASNNQPFDITLTPGVIKDVSGGSRISNLTCSIHYINNKISSRATGSSKGQIHSIEYFIGGVNLNADPNYKPSIYIAPVSLTSTLKPDLFEMKLTDQKRFSVYYNEVSNSIDVTIPGNLIVTGTSNATTLVGVDGSWFPHKDSTNVNFPKGDLYLGDREREDNPTIYLRRKTTGADVPKGTISLWSANSATTLSIGSTQHVSFSKVDLDKEPGDFTNEPLVDFVVRSTYNYAFSDYVMLNPAGGKTVIGVFREDLRDIQSSPPELKADLTVVNGIDIISGYLSTNSIKSYTEKGNILIQGKDCNLNIGETVEVSFTVTAKNPIVSINGGLKATSSITGSTIIANTSLESKKDITATGSVSASGVSAGNIYGINMYSNNYVNRDTNISNFIGVGDLDDKELRLSNCNSNAGIGSKNSDFFISNNGERNIWFKSNGNVGICTSTPAERLDVDGVILSTGLALPSGGAKGYYGASESNYPVSCFENYGWGFTVQDISDGQFAVWNAARDKTFFAVKNGGNVNVSNKLTAKSGEFNDLKVNGTLDVFELTANKTRVTNGDLWIQDSCNAVEISYISDGVYKLEVDSPALEVDDICIVQTMRNDSSIYSTAFQVKERRDEGSCFYDVYHWRGELIKLRAGDTIVKIGNTSNKSRQSSILHCVSFGGYGAATIYYAGVNDLPVGSFYPDNSKITSAIGDLRCLGYGPAATYTADGYFSGVLNAAKGKIANFHIDESRLYATGGAAEENKAFIELGYDNDNPSLQLTNDVVKTYKELYAEQGSMERKIRAYEGTYSHDTYSENMDYNIPLSILSGKKDYMLKAFNPVFFDAEVVLGGIVLSPTITYNIVITHRSREFGERFVYESKNTIPVEGKSGQVVTVPLVFSWEDAYVQVFNEGGIGRDDELYVLVQVVAQPGTGITRLSASLEFITAKLVGEDTVTVGGVVKSNCLGSNGYNYFRTKDDHFSLANALFEGPKLRLSYKGDVNPESNIPFLLLGSTITYHSSKKQYYILRESGKYKITKASETLDGCVRLYHNIPQEYMILVQTSLEIQQGQEHYLSSISVKRKTQSYIDLAIIALGSNPLQTNDFTIMVYGAKASSGRYI